MGQTGLMDGVGELAVGGPAVAAQHAGVISGQHGGGVIEAAALADGMDGDTRRGERPQPRGQTPVSCSTPLQERGRGLRLLAALADEWGVIERTDGKAIWFVAPISRPG